MKGIKVRLIPLFLGLSLLLSVGCALPPKADTLPATPAATTNITPIDEGWQSAPPKSQTSSLPNIADVVARVKPAVVAITTQVVVFDLFNRPSAGEGPAGSGWVIREDGIIVTNNHVVETADNITVILDDGRTFMVDMNRVALDPVTDLAILKIDAKNLPVVEVGDSSALRVGDWVVAIGNALGEGISATTGIVSATKVSLSEASEQSVLDLIQTDAAINLGNSGGPLVNMSGQVIGITSIKIAQVGVEGMGYAISSNEAMPIIKDLITVGYVVRPWLGVSLYTVNQLVMSRFSLEVDKGSLIAELVADSPADKAGLETGDAIVGFNGKAITTTQELIRAIHAAKIGQKVEIVFWRGPAKKTTYATLTERPRPS